MFKTTTPPHYKTKCFKFWIKNLTFGLFLLCFLQPNQTVAQNIILDNSIYEYEDFTDRFYIRTYIHFFVNDPATPWINQQDAINQSNAMLNKLNTSYNKHEIFFVNGADNSCSFTAHSYVIPPQGATNFFDEATYEPFLNAFTGPKGLHIFVKSNTFDLIGGTGGNNGSQGWAFNAPNNYCVVSGQENNVPIALTGVLEHEVGHCLSLLHLDQTWGSSGEEDCPFANCSSDYCCNDLVEDTPTVQSLPVTDPFATNFMVSAFNDWADRNSFTDGQAKRMRHYLKMYMAQPTLQDLQLLPLANAFTPISGNIVVETGQELVIPAGQVVEMLEGTEIRVMRGGRLIVNGTITGACGKMWKGISVEGDDFDTQQNPVYQGYVRANPGSIIEHAEVGIYVGERGVANTGGGIVETYGARFRNNTIGIDFTGYTRTGIVNGAIAILPNKSWFSFSTFTTTADYRGNSKQAPLHMRVGKVNNLTIRYCFFKEERSLCTTRATGISSFNGGLRVSNSQFTGLTDGILTDKLTSLSGSLEAYNNLFSGCETGATASMMSAGYRIMNNNFRLNSIDACDTDNTRLLGLYSTGITLGTFCTGNSFEDTQPTKTGDNRTTGTHCSSIGSSGNEINTNRFVDLKIGNRATGKNGDFSNGLAYFCNEHTHYDFAIADYLFEGKVRAKQGLVMSNGEIAPTGNKFSVAVNRVNNLAESIEYFFFEFDPLQDPTIDLQSTGITEQARDFENTACKIAIEPCDPPCDVAILGDSKSAFFVNRSAY
jgi:hypothetical protein